MQARTLRARWSEEKIALYDGNRKAPLLQLLTATLTHPSRVLEVNGVAIAKP